MRKINGPSSIVVVRRAMSGRSPMQHDITRRKGVCNVSGHCAEMAGAYNSLGIRLTT